MSSRRLTYRGDPGLAGDLASLLRDEGLVVDWDDPSLETEGFGEAAVPAVEMTISGATVAGLTAATKAAIAKFRMRFPGVVEGVDVDDDTRW